MALCMCLPTERAEQGAGVYCVGFRAAVFLKEITLFGFLLLK